MILTDSTHNMTDVAIELLEWDASPESKYLLLSQYLNTGDFVSAAQKLSELNALTDPVSEQMYDLYQVLIPLYLNGGDYRNIDSAGLTYIYELAHSCPSTPAVYMAKAIVDILIHKKIPECPFTDDNRRFISVPQKEHINQYPLLGDNYPDPFSEATNIPCFIPDGAKGQIIIRNMMGVELLKYEVVPGYQTIRIDGKSLQSGLYLYSLVMDGRNFDTRKMIITK